MDPIQLLLRNRPKPKPKPTVRRTTPVYGPPAPPNYRTIDALFPDMPSRSEAEWNTLLDSRVKPFIDSVEKSTLNNRAQAEFQFERSAAANQGLSTAFAGMLMGGKQGDEGAAFAKETYGGAFLPLQAMSLAADRLSQLTNEWNDQDWEISSKYLEAMEKVPGLREQLRSDISNQENTEYERKFKYATLLLDEAWNVYNANAKSYEAEENRRLAAKAIRDQQNLEGYSTRKDAVSEAAKFADDTNTIWKVKRNKDGTWSAYDSGKKKPQKPGSKPSETPARNAALADAKWRTEQGNTTWITKKVNGVWTAVDTGKKKPVKAADKKTGLTPAQQAETDLGTKVQSDSGIRETILGREVRQVNPVTKEVSYERVGAKTYEEARAYLFAIAKAALGPYQNDAYINSWVNQQLRSFFPQGTTSARGGP